MSFEHKKSLGQNFLRDNNIISKIIDSINPMSDDLIIEIGPGEGALTKRLVNKNCDLICFEIDKRLQDTLSNIKSERIRIIYEDFLKVDLKKYIDKKYNNIYFVGNLPYYITTAIINKIMDESDPYEITIMIQKEVALRFAANPHSREYSSISVFLQYNFDIEKVCSVSKNCFEPVPKVDSMVIKLKRNKKFISNNEELLYRLIKDAFKQKRKNLRNNLINYDLLKIEELLHSRNKSLKSRAEELSVEDFVYLSNNL